MTTLAAKGNWDEDFKTDENGKRPGSTQKTDQKKAVYVKWDKSGDYRIRLVGPHVKCRKHFKPYRATVQDNEKDIDPAWLAGFIPQQRYAINVIDRTDGKLKILEKPYEVFKHFANYKSLFHKDPAGMEGPDFNVKVIIPKGDDGNPNPLKTEYAVTNLPDAPFTAEEKKMIKAEGLWPLTEIYRSTSAQKMKELWDALPEDKKIPPKKKEKPADGSTASTPASEKAPATPIEEKMVDAPANADDLFDGSKSVEDTAVDGASLF